MNDIQILIDELVKFRDAALRHDLIDKRQKTIFEIKNLYEKAHYIILFIDHHSDR